MVAWRSRKIELTPEQQKLAAQTQATLARMAAEDQAAFYDTSDLSTSSDFAFASDGEPQPWPNDLARSTLALESTVRTTSAPSADLVTELETRWELLAAVGSRTSPYLRPTLTDRDGNVSGQVLRAVAKLAVALDTSPAMIIGGSGPVPLVGTPGELAAEALGTLDVSIADFERSGLMAYDAHPERQLPVRYDWLL